MAMLVRHFTNQLDEDNHSDQLLTFYHVKCGGQAVIEASLKRQKRCHDIYLIVSEIKMITINFRN